MEKVSKWRIIWIILVILCVGIKIYRRQYDRKMTPIKKEMADIVTHFADLRVALIARGDSAENPNTPVERLKEFASDDVSSIRASVAKNPNAPVEILNDLAKDSVQKVLINVAGNPNTPTKTLKTLANKENKEISIAVANNPNAPAELKNKN